MQLKPLLASRYPNPESATLTRASANRLLEIAQSLPDGLKQFSDLETYRGLNRFQGNPYSRKSLITRLLGLQSIVSEAVAYLKQEWKAPKVGPVKGLLRNAKSAMVLGESIVALIRKGPEDIVPDPDAGEWTTEAWEELSNNIKLMRNLLFGMVRTANNPAFSAKALKAKNQQAKTPSAKKPTGIPKTLQHQLNKWQQDILIRIKKEEDSKSTVARLADEVVSINDAVAKGSKEHLLQRSQRVGLIRYPIVYQGILPSAYWLKKLKRAPWLYAPEPYMRSKKMRPGVDDSYEIVSWWHLSNALLVGTPIEFDEEEAQAVLQASDGLRGKATIHGYPVKKGSHHTYWLVIPTEGNFKVWEWGFLK